VEIDCLMRIAGAVLNPGAASGGVLVLAEPLSFWGAFDPRTGVVIDAHHPQRDVKLSGLIVLLPETRGSGTAAGSIAEAIRLRTAPAAIVLGKPDMNLAIGALIAASLYGHECPVLTVSAHDYAQLQLATHAVIARDGTIEAT
jgi:predicted aconitase with swiveling domain